MSITFTRPYQAFTVSLVTVISFLLCSFGISAQEIKVTVHEGTNMATALSPDGKTLAIDLQGTIYTLPVSGGPATALTDGMGDERQPSWSPDGEKIVFQSYRDGNFHLWTINRDGSNLKQITFGMFDDREPHWSPDGTRIVFTSDRSGNYDIWSLSLEGGELKQITSDPANDFNPAVSYDGRNIAYISARQQGGLFVVNAENVERLLVPAKGTLSAPSWTPAGGHISFTGSYQGKNTFNVVTVSSGEVKVLSTPDEDVFPFRAAWISFQELIYTSNGKLLRKTLDSKPAREIPFSVTLTLNRPVYTKKVRDFDGKAPAKVKGIFGPVVSPDGNNVAFTALGDIYLAKTDGSKPSRLTSDKALDIDPAWSYDGKQLAFCSDRAGGNMNIWIRDMTTSVDKQVTKFAVNALQPAFSPDGKKLAFLLDGGPLNYSPVTLHVLDIASGEAKPLHKPMFTPGKPTWSADGKTIVLAALEPYSSRYREGVSKMLFVPVNGDPVRFYSPVTARSIGQRGKNGPAWSPDGSKIAYVQDGVLWTLSVDNAGKAIHAPVRVTNEMSEAPSWTGDSKSIVFLSNDKLKRVSLLDGAATEIPIDLWWNDKMPQGQTLIHASRVFDGKSATYLKDVDVILEGNRIKEIAPHKTHTVANVIDATGKTLMPGLIEMHTHQNGGGGEMLGRNWLAYGITSVRETGGDPYDALERKESWGAGVRSGPRLFFTGPLLEGSRVYYELASSVSTPLHLDMELERSAVLGYDFLKTYVRMPDYFQRKATAFAHAHGIPVSSHEIYPATAYGVDAVEHMSATSRRGYSPKLTVLNRDYGDVVGILSKSGMSMTPTVALYGGFYIGWQRDAEVSSNRQVRALYSKPYLDAMDAYTKAIVNESNMAGEKFSEMLKTLLKMYTAGVKITAGTDSPFMTYGLSYHVELHNFVEAGLTPYQTLQTATIAAAQAIGVDKDLGTIESGKLADLVIVNGDPLKNIKDAWNTEIVFKNGNLYRIEDLLKGN